MAFSSGVRNSMAKRQFGGVRLKVVEPIDSISEKNCDENREVLASRPPSPIVDGFPIWRLAEWVSMLI